MKFSVIRKFVFKNLRANRLFELPFILSSGLIFIIFNIMASLSSNQYVQKRHAALPTVINIGIVIVGVFTIVFIFYATTFLLKRRNKEFALYAILGLEKNDIRKIIALEFFVLFTFIGFISVVGGYVFGQLTFMGLNKLMHDISGKPMDYPFSIPAMVISIMLIVFLYIVTVVRASFNIYLSTPVQLLEKQYSGEGEPKSRWFLMLIGFVTLLLGYYIAIFTEGTISSLLYFLFASLLVMLATYLLYVSFSIIILKKQRRLKSYYKPIKFLVTSGLLYRIKSNAMSLASISILSVGVILALSATATIYSNIQTTAENILPREYQIESNISLDENNYKNVTQNLKNEVNSTVDNKDQIQKEFISYNMNTVAVNSGNTFKEYNYYKMKGVSAPPFILVYDLSGYNQRTGKNIHLKNNEILMCANRNNMMKMNKIKIGDRTFKVKNIENIIPSKYATEAFCIVVKDFKTMQYLSSVLKTYNPKLSKMENAQINCVMNWNVKGISAEKYRTTLKSLEKKTGYMTANRTEYINFMYELDGGFLFIGVVISIIFLTGTIVITYYKQIVEGYEDRKKYQIMKKIGLEDEIIKKSSASQIVWMFFAPLAIAIFHCLVASKIVYQFLGLFGVKNFAEYCIYFIGTIAIFCIIYFIIFKLTSRVYCKIVQ